MFYFQLLGIVLACKSCRSNDVEVVWLLQQRESCTLPWQRRLEKISFVNYIYAINLWSTFDCNLSMFVRYRIFEQHCRMISGLFWPTNCLNTHNSKSSNSLTRWYRAITVILEWFFFHMFRYLILRLEK